MPPNPRTILAPLVALLFCVLPALGQKGEKIEEAFQVHIFRPAEEKPDEKLIAGSKLPKGFMIAKFADELEKPRMMAVAPNGDVYVTRRDPQNDVWLLRDTDGDGVADERKQVAQIQDVHGIALRDGKVYLAATRNLYVAEVKPDGTLGEGKTLYNDLPDAGQHPNRTLAFNKSGELFLSVGSDFLTGFLIKDNKAQFGRPVGLALAKDGALLVSDDGGGVIYRISYDPAAGALERDAPSSRK